MNQIDLGNLKLHRVVEMEGTWFEPLAFFPDLTAEKLNENRSWMEECGALDRQSGQLVICIQSYVIKTPRYNILVDSCVGNHKERPNHLFWDKMDSPRYLQNLTKAGLSVEDIDFVMCTHLHVDHVGWNTRLENGRWVPTFPNAKYLFSEREFEHWKNSDSPVQIRIMGDSVLPIVAAGQATLVQSDHRFDDNIRLLPTPGHTPDHFAVQVQSGAERAVITGDLIHSPIQMRYPEIALGADFDRALGRKTRRKFLDDCCRDHALVCTAHFPSPSVGRIAKWGDGFRFTSA